MPDPAAIQVIIPTRKQPFEMSWLTDMIECTAGIPVKLLHTGTNASASVNRNLGLSQLSGDVAVMVDDDVDLSMSFGWLSIMLAALSRSEVVMVSAQMLKPDGSFAYMTGIEDNGFKPKRIGETVVPSKKLLTACCAFKHCGLRFDENYIGSGFEDIDFCHQLAAKRPDGLFLVCHDARVVHNNERKNQLGEYWKHNEAYYNKKWGKG